MGYAEEISRDVYGDVELAGRCKALAEEIRDGIMDYGVVNHHKYGRIYAYETDGFGNYNLMDDANSPPAFWQCRIWDTAAGRMNCIRIQDALFFRRIIPIIMPEAGRQEWEAPYAGGLCMAYRHNHAGSYVNR